MIDIPKLPFEMDALEPVISKETIEYHYGKHHMTYVKKLNDAIEGTEFNNISLEAIISSAGGAIFNNAAQVYNHSFYWNSLKKTDVKPSDELLEKISFDFGSFENFKDEFLSAGATLFGSGWVWLVREKHGRLMIVTTENAKTVLTSDKIPLLVFDVWEHAYYIDYRNKRPDYLAKLFDIINWEFVNKNYQDSKKSTVLVGDFCNDVNDPLCAQIDANQLEAKVAS